MKPSSSRFVYYVSALGVSLTFLATAQAASRPPRHNAHVLTNVTAPAQPMPIPEEYFGLHLTPRAFSNAASWPSIGFGPIRLLGNTVNWADVNPAPGVFDFSKLDAVIAAAQARGKTDYLYLLYKTPTWASAYPTDTSCSDYLKRPGGCDAPADLTAGGGGRNQYWKDYVTAIASQYGGPGPGKIRNWEIWNEPDARNEWKGTNAQLVRMAQDAWTIIKAVDPDAVITTPAPARAVQADGSSWMAPYLAAGGGAWADAIAFHGYLNASAVSRPEDLNLGLNALLQARSDNGLDAKPLWDTEASWSRNVNLTDPDLQASFAARYLLLQAAAVARFYWYQFGSADEGTLFDPAASQLNKAGTAYGQVRQWLLGSTPVRGCSAAGTVWTCPFTEASGNRAVAVWDSSQTCDGGTCGASSYDPEPIYTVVHDLSGTVTSLLPGGAVRIGAKPVWLEEAVTPAQ